VRFLLVATALTVLAAGCGGGTDPLSGDVPAVGERVWIEGERAFPDDVRTALDLESLNAELWTEPCGLDIDKGEGGGIDVQTRLGDADEELQKVLGRRWGDIWLDICDDGRGKVGVAPADEAELRRRLAAARAVLRKHRAEGVVDFVAVPVSVWALMKAQRTVPLVDRDGIVGSAYDTSANAIVLEVAHSVDAGGWDEIRETARDTGVNVLIERLETDDLEIVLD
jgi:hypothetical protein